MIIHGLANERRATAVVCRQTTAVDGRRCMGAHAAGKSISAATLTCSTRQNK